MAATSLSSSHAQLSWSLLINQESPCHCLVWSGYGQYRTSQRRCFATTIARLFRLGGHDNDVQLSPVRGWWAERPRIP